MGRQAGEGSGGGRRWGLWGAEEGGPTQQGKGCKWTVEVMVVGDKWSAPPGAWCGQVTAACGGCVGGVAAGDQCTTCGASMHLWLECVCVCVSPSPAGWVLATRDGSLITCCLPHYIDMHLKLEMTH